MHVSLRPLYILSYSTASKSYQYTDDDDADLGIRARQPKRSYIPAHWINRPLQFSAVQPQNSKHRQCHLRGVVGDLESPLKKKRRHREYQAFYRAPPRHRAGTAPFYAALRQAAAINCAALVGGAPRLSPGGAALPARQPRYRRSHGDTMWVAADERAERCS